MRLDPSFAIVISVALWLITPTGWYRSHFDCYDDDFFTHSPKQSYQGLVHMYPFLFENRDFSSGLADRPHVSGENGHWKRIFSKNASQSGDFWKRRLLVYVKPKENRGFRVRWCHTSYTSSMTHASWGILSYFHCFSFYTWKGENNSNTLRVGAYFLKKEETSSVFKNIGIRMDSPSTYLWLDSWVQTIIVLAVIGVKVLMSWEYCSYNVGDI